ncbi:Alpha/Beta hydrolase protein, partial [Leptodontidium sp. MPI-SDFR-AT-0119]
MHPHPTIPFMFSARFNNPNTLSRHIFHEQKFPLSATLPYQSPLVFSRHFNVSPWGRSPQYMITDLVPQKKKFCITSLPSTRQARIPLYSTIVTNNILTIPMINFKLSDIDLLITLFLLCPSHTSPEEAETKAEVEVITSGTESSNMSTPSPIIQHSGLNTTFTGCRHRISSSENEIWQFRGIKYANIPGRFKQSSLNTSFEKQTDSTRYGPKCPQPPQTARLEDTLIGLPASIASHQPDTFSEFQCLNLNITTPAGAKAGDDLPVLVYVHGGGGFSGSNSDWWCDGGSIVKRSVEIGKPIITVAINYRLSVFGYMASDELAQLNGPDNAANFGPRDVHTALTWLSQNITPFGGSPTNITASGESHGSVLIHTLLHCHPPAPISRAILQSQFLNTPIFTTPLTLSSYSPLYHATKTALNITTLSQLETVPYQDLLTAYTTSNPRNGLGHTPVIDEIFLPSNFTEKYTFTGPLIIGTTGNESTVISSVASNFPLLTPKPSTSNLLTTLSSSLSSLSSPNNNQNEKLTPILSTYTLASSTTPSQTSATLLSLIEDLAWYHAADSFATHARTKGIKVHEYSFEQPQPFGGVFKGVPTHSLDLAYLFGHPEIFDGMVDELGEREKERTMQRRMQDSWIRF